MGMCAYVRVCVSACVRVCVCVCARVPLRGVKCKWSKKKNVFFCNGVQCKWSNACAACATLHTITDAHSSRIHLHNFAVPHHIQLCITGWRRAVGCLIYTSHVPQKSPIISGSFAENDLLYPITFSCASQAVRQHIQAYEWGITHTNESWHESVNHVTYQWVMAHMNESWHMWMSHGTYEWVMVCNAVQCN